MPYQTPENSFDRLTMIDSHITSDVKTLIDWGSAEGFFAINLAKMHPSLDILSVESNQQPTFETIKPTDYQKEQKQILQLNNLHIVEEQITEEFVSKVFSGQPLVDCQLLINLVHHFKFPKEQWYEFVFKFVSIARKTFIMLPSLEESKKEKVWHHEMFKSWYGNSTHPFELIMFIMNKWNLHCTIKPVGEWYSSYGEGKRIMYLIERQKCNIVPIISNWKEEIEMLLRQTSDPQRVDK